MGVIQDATLADGEAVDVPCHQDGGIDFVITATATGPTSFDWAVGVIIEDASQFGASGSWRGAPVYDVDPDAGMYGSVDLTILPDPAPASGLTPGKVISYDAPVGRKLRLTVFNFAGGAGGGLRVRASRRGTS